MNQEILKQNFENHGFKTAFLVLQKRRRIIFPPGSERPAFRSEAALR